MAPCFLVVLVPAPVFPMSCSREDVAPVVVLGGEFFCYGTWPLFSLIPPPPLIIPEVIVKRSQPPDDIQQSVPLVPAQQDC